MYGTILRSKAACAEINPKGLNLETGDLDVKIMRNVTLRPFETCHVHAITKVGGHDQRVNVAIEPPSNPYSGAVITVPSYTHLRPGFSQTEVCLCNLSRKTVILNAKSIIAQVAATKAVPAMLIQKGESIADDVIAKQPKALSNLTLEQKEKLFQKVELSDIKDWTTEEQAN